MRILSLAVLMLGLGGCVSMQSVSLTSIPARKGKEITAQKSRLIILGFNFDNDYVNELVEDLKNQCPNGQVKGILTKDEIVDYFLMLVHTRRVTATGYCQTGEVAQMGAGL